MLFLQILNHLDNYARGLCILNLSNIAQGHASYCLKLRLLTILLHIPEDTNIIFFATRRHPEWVAW